MEVVTIGCEKGGVGKTYVTICLASALKSLGYRVLVIDMDKSGNFSTTALSEIPEQFMYDVLLNRCKLKDIIQHTDLCDVAPTINITTPATSGEYDIAENRSLTQLASLLSGRPGAERILRKIIMDPANQLQKNYDFVLIDTGAVDGLLINLTLVAADRAILVTEPASKSIDGLIRFYSHITTNKEYYNPDLEIDGLVFSKYSVEGEAKRHAISQITSLANEYEIPCYNNVLRHTELCDKAFSTGTPVIEYLYAGVAAIDALNLALEFLSVRGMEPRTIIPGTKQDENGNWYFERLPKEEYDSITNNEKESEV